MKRFNLNNKNVRRGVRHARIRRRLFGTAEAPRLSVFRSLRGLEAQLIDDTAGQTLAAVNSRGVKPEAGDKVKAKVAMAYAVGKTIAAKAQALGISRVAFDRGGYRYHGRVAAVAEGARAAGLKL